MLQYEKFLNCENEYRPAPFWSWNDKLDRNELLKQLHELRRQGMGGFFMHARGGLMDEYLATDFLHAVRACVEEADRLGMKAWLYDENFAPSGYAGGKITKEHPEFIATALEMEKTDEGLSYRIVPNEPLAHQDHQPNTDLCNKDAVDCFIAYTHEKYKQIAGEYFGGTIPGIFTDEPHFSPESKKKIRLPWTKDFEKKFAEVKGYDIREHLDKLFVRTEGSEKVRFDYWDVISDLFTRAYVRNIYEWCGKNGILFTGHYYEHIFPDPTRTGYVMPNYAYMDIPGIDMLFNTKDEKVQFGNVFIVKEASSVGNQLNKKRILSETYGASGWELGFEDQKRIADWLFALGVNFICQHLVHYSLRGYRKRDYPLSFYAHQPWWECYRVLADYIGRLFYVLSSGHSPADILVLHPSCSTWTEYSPDGSDHSIEEIGRSVRTLARNLCEIQYLYDLGDESIIKRHGSVDGDKFIIGQARYKTVILPSMTVMRSSTFELLKEFSAHGGTIICTGLTPNFLDGVESEELQLFFSSETILKTKNDRHTLRKVLQMSENLHVDLEDSDGKKPVHIYCHYRDGHDKAVLFMCNISKTEHYTIRLKLNHDLPVEEWDAATGKKLPLNTYRRNGQRYVNLDFHPVESHLLILYKSEKVDLHNSDVQAANEKITERIELHDWKASRLDYNIMTLNRCSASMDGADWVPEDNVLLIDHMLKDSIGVERASVFSRQPWTYPEEMKSKIHSVKAKYSFTVEENMNGNIFVAAESPDVYDLFVNGVKIKPAGKSFKDRAFMMYDIREAVIEGINEVLLTTDRYGVLTSLESIYVIGDFKLIKSATGFSLKNEDGITVGDWTKQGYPYYSGAMEYTCSFDVAQQGYNRVEFAFEEFQGAVAKVLVNQQDAGIIGWKPYKIDITPYIRYGTNQIKIQVMNSLQNMLGPHHMLPREGIVAPESFFCKEDVKFMPGGFYGKGVVMIYGSNG